MDYQIMPMGDIWTNGIINIPKKIASDYIKMASEYQLKALLLILCENGKQSSREIARALGCTEKDADDFLEFWVEEGVLSVDGKISEAPAEENKPSPSPEKPRKKEAMPIPILSPKDIVSICRESAELTELMRNSQEVLGKTLSHNEQELIINMVTYYGLPCEVVLTILQYTKSEKDKGRALGTAYINAMAKDWSEEGIASLSDADVKLRELAESDRMWSRIVDMSGIRHRNPTAKQREMIKAWCEDFSMDMIALACDAMKENADKPTLKYVDGVLKNWKKKGIKTPEQVKEENQRHASANEERRSGKLKSMPNFDIDEITKQAMFDDNYDI